MDRPVDDVSDLQACWGAFEPAPIVGHTRWCEDTISNNEGKPYDREQYPHITAPGGPADADDDPGVRSIDLQWGVRLGKTFFGYCLLLKRGALAPAPMMIATAKQKLAKELVERLYETIRQSRLSRILAKPPHLQSQSVIEFRGSRCYVAWSKSPATLADKNIKVGLANEIDKWEQVSTSKEGEPLDLFLDRFNDYHVVRKIVTESTPTVKGHSRIERRRLRGTNCRFEVPCPHCRRYQVIEFGGPDTPHGIKWQHGADGRSNPDLAEATAHYICRHCRQAIPSDHRPWMFARGVWCPEGATVRSDIALDLVEGRRSYDWRGWSRAEWVEGAPLRDGENASYHLPALYALAFPTWGVFAKRFVEVASRKQSLRTFVNQILANTWELASAALTWEQVGKRLITDIPAGVIPAGYSLVTIGCDKQLAHYAWLAIAWGPELRGHILGYGTCQTVEELELVLLRRWPAQQGESQTARLSLIDSGYRPAVVHRYVRRARKKKVAVLVCRGAREPLGTFVTVRKLSEKSSAPGQRVVMVDATSTQDWMESCLYSLKPGDPGSLALHAASLFEHQDLLEQLLNEGALEETSQRTGLVSEVWMRRDTHIPNDARDCARYAYAAAQLVTRGQPLRAPKTAADKPRPTMRAPKRPPSLS